MRHFPACLLALAVAAPTFAAGADLKEARERWLRGNYEEARELYQELAKFDKNRPAAVLGLSRAWQSEGQYEKALAVVNDALRDGPAHADLLARRGELLFLRGRWGEAEQAADQAVALAKDHFAARWVRAQVYRDRGDIKKADAEFRWFVRAYTERSDRDQDVKDPDELLLVGLAGAENARWNSLSDQFQFILNEVWGDALKQDKLFWPAEYQAGALLLEKYNRGDALTSFDKALAINPRAAEAYVGKGVAALQKYEIKDAEQFAERALKINPRLVEALNLRADVHLASGSVEKALKELEQAREVNPRDEACLGRVAACLFLQRKADDLQKLTQEVEKYDPKAGVFYFTLGERLEERRRYEDAETYYKKALELRPQLPWSRNSLGMLYMRMGREAEARTILVKAFEADEFNVRVSNTLKVLRHLEKYETLKTEHFELRFDPQLDRHLARYMARYLEEIYAGLAEKFHHRPAGPFLVEVFNNHEMFSGRVVALPDLHTIGACTGRMVALVSPRGKGLRKPFNWARVLRHELVHIFNLDQTHFLVPHWYTEGLAVMSEGFPRPQEWNRLLVERVASGELLDLETVNLGFIRPRSPLEWNLAYCQSQLYIQYIQEKHGAEAIGALLQAFGEGLNTEAALARVCRVDRPTFEKGYRTYLDGIARTLKGRPVEKPMTFRELRDAHEADPDNPDLASRLADYYLKRDKAKARQLAEAVLAKKKAHPLASYVKAQLLHAGGEEDKALPLLEAAVDPDNLEPKVLELLGKLYFEARQPDKAAAVFEQAHQAEPHEGKWLSELVRVYGQTGATDKQIRALEKLVPTDADDLDSRKQLARLLRDAKRFAEAERYAREALEIDVLDAEAEQLLGEALLGQKKAAAAAEVFEVVVSLHEQEMAIEKEDEARLNLARAYGDAGQKQKALNEVTKVLAHNPENAAAIELKARLEK